MSVRIKTYSYFLFFSLFITSCLNQEYKKVEILINNWEFRELGQQWFPAKVPGSVHLDLYSNNLIDDPFYRANENKLQWIEDKQWEYKAKFNLDRDFIANKNIHLIFSGIDTYADVYLNDSLIQKCDNYFVSYDIKLDSLLKVSNELRFVFESTVDKAKFLQKNNTYYLPGEERVYVRKPQFHFGWDWGPRFIGCGITEKVKLVASNKPKIYDFYMSTLSISDTKAEMRLEIELSDIDTNFHTLDFLGKKYPLKSKKSIIDFTIENPKLWWPRGYGDQFIYPLNIKLLSSKGQCLDEVNSSFSIRNIRLVEQEDEMGKGFKFQVNGIDVFAKGANYIPLDFFHTRIDSFHYRDALYDAVEANMNMLRVWGGGIYEDDYFYDLCDSLGILVWQDFMFACAMYPGDKVFMNSVKLEAIQQIKRLRKHPSIALWCGNNENSEGWHRWGWQSSRSDEEIKSIWEDYQDLFTQLLPNLVDSLTNTDYWESSPKYGRGDPQHKYKGDAHYWGIWHDSEPFENFELKVPRFMSEFGFQSFLDMNAISKFTINEDLSLDSEVINSHQKHPRGNKLIKEYMQRHFNDPKDFKGFVYLSQILQAEGVCIGIESHRRAKPYNMGTLYWQFNDCWPSISWSSRDFYGNWKALHYAAKKSFEDILISTVQSEDSLFVYIVNDSNNSSECNLLFDHIDYYGNHLDNEIFSTKFYADSSALLKAFSLNDFLLKDGIENRSYLDIKMMIGDEVKSRKIHHFVKTKQMDLQSTNITCKIYEDSSGFNLEILSDEFVKDLMIECTYEGRFEFNYFDLPANESKQIRFFNENLIDEFDINSISFYSIIDSYE